ncbi:MAG: class I SAM-dependent methyltransferase [Pirellulales bacterium]
MLARVLEPEVMDTPEEALAYDAMDHSEVNRLFVDDFLRAAAGRPGQAIDVAAALASLQLAPTNHTAVLLDLGTGTAQIPVELCRRDAGFRVLAVDLSPSMLNLARSKIEVASLTSSIRLDLVDAKGLTYADGRFAAVMSNSIVHHIPEPAQSLAEALRVLAPGGLIFFRDLLRPADGSTVELLVETYAADCTEHQRQLFDDSLRAALTLDEIRGIVQASGQDPQQVHQTSDRHWTWSARIGG